MNNKIIFGIIAIILVVAGGWYAYTQMNSSAQIANQNQYECTGHVTFAMTFAPDFASVHIVATNGGTYPPDSTLTRTDPGNSAGARYESNGIVLTGTGNTVALGDSSSTVSCSPVSSSGNMPTNFGAPETSGGVNNEPFVSGQYLAGSLLLGFNQTDALGKYLIGFGPGLNGMTLYTYAKDKDGLSNCIGQCAVNWPPYTIIDKRALTILEAGVTGQVGTITRADLPSGTMQVTYNGKPLYFYKNDLKPDDTQGENVDGVWFIVAP